MAKSKATKKETLKVVNNTNTVERSISDILDNEYKDYSTYVLEGRAVPSVIDGFKPVHRKIIETAYKTWKTGNEKPMKVFQLTGKVSNQTYYHHGDMSLNGAIIGMAQSFKNNLPLLDDIGQYGSLRSPSAGAPRYISTRLTDNFKLIYKDFDLLTPKYEEGYEIEPQYFLPIIPMVLINGGSGIAVGYSSNIINRSPNDIIDNCIAILEGKRPKKIKPYLNGFNGNYIDDKEVNNKWVITGNYDILNTSTVRITEIPPSMTYEKWEAHLEKLLDDKKVKSYDDNSIGDNIDYTIKMEREVLSSLLKQDDGIIKLFKLSENQYEFFTTLDEKGKLRLFSSANDIVKYFVDFRLKYYDKRKKFLLNKIENDILVLDNKALFVKAILDGKIVINNKSKVEIEKQIKPLKLDKKEDSYDYLLRMPINSLTKENWQKLQADQKDKKKYHAEVKKSKPKDIYIQELKDLKSKLK